jgi:DEAD/DEAH box helicase domain-containing protein
LLHSGLASQLEQVACDAIRTALHPTTPGFAGLLDRFLADWDPGLIESLVKSPIPA